MFIFCFFSKWVIIENKTYKRMQKAEMVLYQVHCYNSDVWAAPVLY